MEHFNDNSDKEERRENSSLSNDAILRPLLCGNAFWSVFSRLTIEVRDGQHAISSPLPSPTIQFSDRIKLQIQWDRHDASVKKRPQTLSVD